MSSSHEPPFLPLGHGPKLGREIVQAVAERAKKNLPMRLDRDAPPLLREWVGRENQLTLLNYLWLDPGYHVVSLIGFGGEGKSSLARQWLDDLLKSSDLSQPDGVFWWSFYERQNVDELFEVALRYFSQEKTTREDGLRSDMYPKLLAGMLKVSRYLIVLDGFEVMQHQQEDFGLIRNARLAAFLDYVAAEDHLSFCLITSRAPVVDLLPYITHSKYDVERLPVEDGKELLIKLGVQGSDQKLRNLVEQWGGHALTLSLIGTYLREHYAGDMKHLSELPSPSDPYAYQEYRENRVYRILRRYDEHLTDAERRFMQILSTFRLPVPQLALSKPVFQVKPELPEKLVDNRILQYNQHKGEYTAHPLIRAYYSGELEENPVQFRKVHQSIADYYRLMERDLSDKPTLDDLKSWLEAVHHLCAAGKYNEAYEVLDYIYYQDERKEKRRKESILTHQLGAYETALTVLQEFFPMGNTTQEPLVNNFKDKCFLLQEVGISLMNLGRTNEVPFILNRHNQLAQKVNDWSVLNSGSANLARVYIYLGKLRDGVKYAEDAYKYAKSISNNREKHTAQLDSLMYLGQAYDLLGDIKEAGKIFSQANRISRELYPHSRYLFGNYGVYFADYLRRKGGNPEYARQVAQENLEYSQDSPDDLSRSHQILGDLNTERGEYDEAYREYNTALQYARRITHWPSLITALAARGYLLTLTGDLEAAQSNLEEALDYARTGSYGIYEADIRVKLAWFYLKKAMDLPETREENRAIATDEAKTALQMSQTMEYYWGQLDAQKVLDELYRMN